MKSSFAVNQKKWQAAIVPKPESILWHQAFNGEMLRDKGRAEACNAVCNKR